MVVQHPDSIDYGTSAIGYVVWKRQCNIAYPSWAMPGAGSMDTCRQNVTSTDRVSDLANRAYLERGPIWEMREKPILLISFYDFALYRSNEAA